MEHGGTLRKRARRPIAKVKEQFPVFTLNPSSSSSTDDLRGNASTSSSAVYSTGSDTRISVPLQKQGTKKQISCSAISSSQLFALKVIIMLGIICGVFPWKWHGTRRRIVKWSNATSLWIWKIVWLFGFLQTGFLFCYHFRNWIGMWQIEGIPYKAMFSYFLCVHWHAMSTIKRIVIILYGDKILRYINMLIDFNNSVSASYLICTDKDSYTSWGKKVINFGIPAGFSQILNSAVFFIVMPYQPWYLTSMIWPKPWYWLVPGALQDINLVGHVIAVYTLTCWIIVLHANTVQFWLRESHKDNDSGCTVSELRDEDAGKALELYKSLRVLCVNYNDTMAPMALPVMKIEVANGLIPCWYVLLRTADADFSQEWSSILTNAFGVITLSVVGFGCLSVGGQMFDISGGFIHSWTTTNTKEFKSTLRSFPTLNMKIAGFYCISGATAVTFFRIIFDWVVNCVITFRE